MLLDLPLPVLAEVLHGCLSHLEGQCALCALRCSSHVGCALGSGEYLLSAVVRRWPLAYASAMAEIADGTVDAYFAELSKGDIEAFLRGAAAADSGAAEGTEGDEPSRRHGDDVAGLRRWCRFTSLERMRRQTNRLAVKALNSGSGWKGAGANSGQCSHAVRVAALHATQLDCFTDSSDVFASMCAPQGHAVSASIGTLPLSPACGFLALALARSCAVGSGRWPASSASAASAAAAGVVVAEGQDKTFGVSALQRRARLLAARQLAHMKPTTLVLTIYEWGRLEGNYGNRFQYRTRDIPSCVRIGLLSYVNHVAQRCDLVAHGDTVSEGAEEAAFTVFTHSLEVRARKAAPSNVRSARLHLEVKAL